MATKNRHKMMPKGQTAAKNATKITTNEKLPKADTKRHHILTAENQSIIESKDFI